MAIELWREAAGDVASQIQDISNDEQEAFDNLPESLQQGEKGMDMESAISALENALSELQDNEPDWDNWSSDDIVRSLDEAKGM